MKKISIKFLFLLFMFLSFGTYAQIDLVCLELTVGEETSIIAVTENIVEETQAALEEQGISSEIVECEDDFEVDIEIHDQEAEWNPFPEVDITCLELTVDGETSIIGISTNILDETQAALAEQGIESEVVECEDDFEIEFPEWEWPVDTFPDFPEVEIVCLEITVGEETSIIGVSANIVEETQVALAEQGIESVIVECEDDFEIEYPEWEWPVDTFPEFPEVEIVCLEITAGEETSIIGVSANIVEETQAALAEQGIESVVVECEDDFEIEFPEWEWPEDDYPNDFPEVDFVCLEITAGEQTSIIAVTSNIVEETQAALAEQGYESVIVECDDDIVIDLPDCDWPIDTFPDFPELEDLVCLQITAEGESSVIAVTANVVEEVQASLEEQGYTSEIVDCEDGIEIDFPEWPGDNGEETDPEFPEVDIVCLELTVGEETSIIGVSANIVEETQAALAEQGITSVVVECEDIETPLIEDIGIEFVQVNQNIVTDLSVYPNPAKDVNLITVNFDSVKEEQVTVNVMNQFGQQVQSIQLNASTGSNSINLNTIELGAGMYIVSLTNGKEINLTEKLLIVK